MNSFRACIATLALVFCSSIAAFAQENQLEIFSEMGEEFTLYLNGAQQNEAPVTHLLLKDLPSPSYKARVVFAESRRGMFMDNVYTPKNLGDAGRNTYMITVNRKGEYKLKYQSYTPMDQLPVEEPDVQQPVAASAPSTSTTTSTSHQVQSSTQVEGEQVNMSVNVGGQQVGVSVSTSSTSSGGNMQMDMDMNADQTVQHETMESSAVTATGDGCDYPMSDRDYDAALASIKSKKFEDSKEQLAGQILNSNCLNANQVRDIMKAFQFEETRLDFAKSAYDRVYDQGNFFKVNDAFQFELSIDELNEYIESR